MGWSHESIECASGKVLTREGLLMSWRDFVHFWANELQALFFTWTACQRHHFRSTLTKPVDWSIRSLSCTVETPSSVMPPFRQTSPRFDNHFWLQSQICSMVMQATTATKPLIAKSYIRDESRFSLKKTPKAVWRGLVWYSSPYHPVLVPGERTPTSNHRVAQGPPWLHRNVCYPLDVFCRSNWTSERNRLSRSSRLGDWARSWMSMMQKIF